MTRNRRYGPAIRHRMVVDAAVFGIRPTAETYDVSPSTVHFWVNHADYRQTYDHAKLAVCRLAAELREKAA